MGNDLHEPAGRPQLTARPRFARPIVWALELGLIIFIGYLLVQITLSVMADSQVSSMPSSQIVVEKIERPNLSALSTFDPFYRQVSQAMRVQSGIAVPESSLKIDVFGLRAMGGGQGSAIVNMQEDGQKLIHVGQEIAAGVQLTGVFSDRLEISRAGIREAVFLRPEAERRRAMGLGAALSNSPQNANIMQSLAAELAALELQQIQQGQTNVGFQLPTSLPAPLRFLGLEARDILVSINGAPLTSRAHIQAIITALPASSGLEFEVERGGIKHQIPLALKGSR